MFLEPVRLIGEGEYNLNVLKEIKVTESYLGLDENITGCHNEESFMCTTKEYVDTTLKNCGCLPLNMRLSDKVELLAIKHSIHIHYLQYPLCSPMEGKCAANVKVDTLKCLKPCSGLIITTLSKSEQKKNWMDLFPISEQYDKYKIKTDYPNGMEGELNH